MNSSNLTENVDYLFKSLENFTQNEGIIGKPVVQGDKTFLPVVSITVGYGGGNAAMGKGKQGGAAMGAAAGSAGSESGALGLGAKLSTDAVILIDKDNVSMLPMGANVGTIVDKIPQIINGMNQNKQSGQAQNQGQSTPQSY